MTVLCAGVPLSNYSRTNGTLASLLAPPVGRLFSGISPPLPLCVNVWVHSRQARSGTRGISDCQCNSSIL